MTILDGKRSRELGACKTVAASLESPDNENDMEYG